MMLTFAETIKKARKKLNISQEQLASVFVNRKFPHILTEFSPRGKKLLFFKPSLCFH